MYGRLLCLPQAADRNSIKMSSTKLFQGCCIMLLLLIHVNVMKGVKQIQLETRSRDVHDFPPELSSSTVRQEGDRTTAAQDSRR